MTTLYIRDGEAWREAAPTEVLDRATALINQRYRTGTPVLSSPNRTREFLRLNAAAVILVHNHPSGVSDPSQADELITARLRDALTLVDIPVIDHLIVGGTDTCSLAERGSCEPSAATAC